MLIIHIIAGNHCWKSLLEVAAGSRFWKVLINYQVKILSSKIGKFFITMPRKIFVALFRNPLHVNKEPNNGMCSYDLSSQDRRYNPYIRISKLIEIYLPQTGDLGIFGYITTPTLKPDY
uniref:Uncharacterized protein n=1 Tax=Rhizophagus irregularis (strain DAOM 181602 / DAOM 197198 / MUCL 43194) TaxID=747089 RepID=U9U0L3_RHIID